MLVGRYPSDNQTRGWQVRYEEHCTMQPTLGVTGTKGHEDSAPNQYQWRKPSTAKEVSDQFTEKVALKSLDTTNQQGYKA